MRNCIKPPTLSASFSKNGKRAKRRFENIFNTKAKKTGIYAFVLLIFMAIAAGGVLKHRQNFGVIEYGTLGFSVSIPSYWEGKYHMQSEAQDSVSFYHAKILQKYGEGTGWLLTIRRLELSNSKKEAQDTPRPAKYLMQSGGYTFVMEIPSNAQYPVWEGGDADLANEYAKMAEGIAVIENSIRPLPENRTRGFSPDSEQLYNLKNTYIGDAQKVRRIAELSGFMLMPIHSIQLKTESAPYGLIVKFMVDNRAVYRFFDYSEFTKRAAIIFALIPNVDELRFAVFDKYASADQPDSAFVWSYYDRQNLSQRPGAEFFISENIINATKNEKTFSEYINKVANIAGNSAESPYLLKVYEIIGEDCEIIVNSAMGLNAVITKDVLSDKSVNEILNNVNISLDAFIGKDIRFSTTGVRNFKTGERTSYLLIYDDDSLAAYADLQSESMDRELITTLVPYSYNGGTL
ncbi:MAG: DUF4825 domain-containing protein [Firmicutes bacterium]|nr:DUF4825 domain-containing protein [Bacillota bacterium]